GNKKAPLSVLFPGSIVYLGMMVGAFFWGGMSDKVGRRQCLLICMSTNGFFAFLSSFVQGYGLFLLCRVVAGFGIGGAVPIVFSFFAEVLSREKRGEHLSWLCMFWMIGEIYASAMAWAIIPHYASSSSSGGSPRRSLPAKRHSPSSVSWAIPWASSLWDVPGTPSEESVQEASGIDARATSTGSSQCGGAAALLRAPPGWLSSSPYL
ncbi:hypothetical protein ILYODFUR_021359, partial [Ilyodon furcidens]